MIGFVELQTGNADLTFVGDQAEKASKTKADRINQVSENLPRGQIRASVSDRASWVSGPAELQRTVLRLVRQKMQENFDLKKWSVRQDLNQRCELTRTPTAVILL